MKQLQTTRFGIAALLIICGCSESPQQGGSTTCEPQTVSKVLDARLESGALSIGGQRVAVPCNSNDLIAILGEPTRTFNLENTILVWDESGIYASRHPDRDVIHEVAFAIGCMDLQFFPTNLYDGSIGFANCELSKSTTARELRAMGFSQDRILPFVYRYPLGDERVYVMFDESESGILYLNFTVDRK